MALAVQVFGIANDSVTFAKMQNIATERLVGRGTALAGDPEELTLSSDYGLTFTYAAGSLKIDTPQDLQAAASPTFVTVKCSGLTTGYVPYHVADITGLANSPIFTDGTNVGIGATSPSTRLYVQDTNSNVMTLHRNTTASGWGRASSLNFVRNETAGDLTTQLGIGALLFSASSQNVAVDNYAQIGAYAKTTDTKAGKLIFSTNNGSGLQNFMVLDSSGNVTIGGTDTTTSKFEVVTAGGATGLVRFKGVTGTMRFYPYYNATYGAVLESMNAVESGYLPFTLSGNPFIFYGGNLGIKTTLVGAGVTYQELNVNGSQLFVGADSTQESPMFQIVPSYVVNTHASYTSRTILSQWAIAGAQEVMRFESGAAAMLSFFGVNAVVRPTALTAALTAITHTAPGTPDYALQDLIDSSAGACFGFATKDEGNTLLSAVVRNQVRLGEIETKLQALGLLT